jgi:UDP-N-acetylglucosamine 4,6-dehydratase
MKKILIFGGTGSLGYELTKRYITDNNITIFSRDENKQWNMKIDFNNSNLKFIIGNVSNYDAVLNAINYIQPQIIIIASAMKHIDICEYNINESINTNIIGTQNILKCIDLLKPTFLETVLFVSSDKACSPVNNYGMCKAISETLMVEKSFYNKNYKYVTVRYGNVLNSRGSIIPLLHRIGKDSTYKHFTLTDRNMTRFVMTLEQSVDLIDYAIKNGESGDIIIPELVSLNVKDLLEIFSELYNKPYVETKVRPGEKLLESLINETQSMRAVKKNGYTHIKSLLSQTQESNIEIRDYNSKLNPVNKEQLNKILSNLNLL